MGRAMKSFYNPVRRSVQAQSDQSCPHQTEHKNRHRLQGPYLASTPWRRHNAIRASPSSPSSAASQDTSEPIRPLTPTIAEYSVNTVASELGQPEHGTDAAVQAEPSDVLRKYSEEPFDLDGDCDDAIEEYFLSPLQVAQRAQAAAAAAYTTLQQASPNDSIGQTNPEQSLIAEQRLAAAQLEMARSALADVERDRAFLAHSGFAPPPSTTSATLDSLSTSLYNLASAPRLSHRQPPNGSDTQFLHGGSYPSHDLSASTLSTAQVTPPPTLYPIQGNSIEWELDLGL